MNKCLYRNTMDVKWSTFMSNCHIIVLPSHFDKYLTCDTLLIGNHKLFMYSLVSSKKRVILVSADDVLHIVVFPGMYEIAMNAWKFVIISMMLTGTDHHTMFDTLI